MLGGRTIDEVAMKANKIATPRRTWDQGHKSASRPINWLRSGSYAHTFEPSADPRTCVLHEFLFSSVLSLPPRGGRPWPADLGQFAVTRLSVGD